MDFLYTNYEEKLGALKPCVECTYMGTYCFGANMSARPFSEIIAWCIARKKVLNITNAAVADRSGVSLPTINRLFSGAMDSCNRETIVRIVQVLIDPAGDAAYCACPFIAAETPVTVNAKDEADKLHLQISTLLAENHALKEQLADADSKAEFRVARALEDKAKTSAHLKEQIAEMKLSHKEVLADLKSRNKTLSILLGIAAGALVVLLLADLFLPAHGWVRY